MNSNGRRCNSNWHTALLNDLAEVNPKLPNILASSDVVSFVPMSAISAETAGVDREETRTYQEVGKGYTPFVSGDLLIAKITPCFENGKIIQAQLRHSVGFGSTEFHVIRPHKRKLNPRYGLHYLRQEWIRRAGERRMTGSAGQRRVPEAFFAGLRIPLPPLYEQRRIAKILDQAEALRAKRRATLIQLDSFTQSVFFDLFGDPLTNPNNMKVVRLADVATRITDGVHLKPNYTDGGVPFISVKDISTGRLIFDNCRFISPEDHQRFTKRCKPERHDILYTKIGTYGRPALIETDREFSIYVSVCLIKPRKELVNPHFLSAALATSAIKRQADRSIKGIGVPDLHLDQIQGFLIPLPPMNEQREFARRIATVEKLKQTQRASLAEMDALFASLQYRAFNGQL